MLLALFKMAFLEVQGNRLKMFEKHFVYERPGGMHETIKSLPGGIHERIKLQAGAATHFFFHHARRRKKLVSFEYNDAAI